MAANLSRPQWVNIDWHVAHMIFIGFNTVHKVTLAITKLIIIIKTPPRNNIHRIPWKPTKLNIYIATVVIKQGTTFHNYVYVTVMKQANVFGPWAWWEGNAIFAWWRILVNILEQLRQQITVISSTSYINNHAHWNIIQLTCSDCHQCKIGNLWRIETSITPICQVMLLITKLDITYSVYLKL